MRNEKGLALVATLMTLVLLAALLVVAMQGAVMTTRTQTLDHQNVQVGLAAEAGAEAALAQIEVALEDGALDSTEAWNIRPPTDPAFASFSYDSFTVRPVGGIVVETLTDGAYAGLYALTQKVDVYSEASDAMGNRDAVYLGAKAQAIPIFQFGVFFEGDLEATNGPPMEFIGRVHSNGNVYLSSDNAWYRSIVTTPNLLVHNRKDFDDVENGVYINDASGNEIGLDFDSRSIPGAEAFKTRSCTQFDCRVMTDAFEVDSLKVPLPDGVTPYEVIAPRDASDTQRERRVKYAWKADLYVFVDISELASKKVCDVANAKPKKCEEAVQYDWEAFYDGRERRYVDVMEIDLRKLMDENPEVSVIYFEFDIPQILGGMDPSGDGVWPVVLLWNAAELPRPITVATNRPIYVRGDFNSVNKVPAAIIADAVTLLSNAWDDARHICDSWNGSGPFGCATWGGGFNSYRSPATPTTVNAAIMAGMVPTPCDWYESGCPSDGSTAFYQNWYSGGIENFPRFLENWSDVTLTYRGSLVSLYASQFAVGTWNGTYYDPPDRDWGFDTMFEDPTKLPPATPNVGYVRQLSFRPAF